MAHTGGDMQPREALILGALLHDIGKLTKRVNLL